LPKNEIDVGVKSAFSILIDSRTEKLEATTASALQPRPIPHKQFVGNYTRQSEGMALRTTFSIARNACGRGNPGLLANRMMRVEFCRNGRSSTPRFVSAGAASAGISVVPYPAATRFTSVSSVAACIADCKPAFAPQAARE
jgi:hypothetical protein